MPALRLPAPLATPQEPAARARRPRRRSSSFVEGVQAAASWCARLQAALAAAVSTRTTADGYGLPKDRAARRVSIFRVGLVRSTWRLRAMLALQSTWVTLFFDLAIIVNSAAVLVRLSSASDVDRHSHGADVAQWLQLPMILIFMVGRARGRDYSRGIACCVPLSASALAPTCLIH
jgi:hypothetical protein